MTTYILRRLIALIPVLLIGSAIIFFSMRLFAPYDIIEETLAETPGAGDPEVEAKLREEFGLDKPIYVQYTLWLWGAVRGDLGTSWTTGYGVMESIAISLPVSLELTFIGLFLAVIMGVPLGALSAVNKDSKLDYFSRLFAIIGLSVPNFVLATLLIMGAAIYFRWVPDLGYTTFWEDPFTHFTQIFMPVIALGSSVAATKVRLLRSTMLEVLRNDYVRTARAKGLRERVVVYRHALKNAMIPVVTVLGSQVSASLGGTVVIEHIFSLPGIGRLSLDAINQGDFPMLQGTVLYLMAIYVVINLIVDISYAWLDPRIRYN